MSARKYYGGDKVSPAIVYPLKASNFKELVDHYVNVPHPLKVKREEFLSWDKDKRDAFKDGPYFVSVTFKEGTTRRKGENAEKAVIVCLDIDDPDLARDFVESPSVLFDALYPYSFAAYTTTSHTPAAPKLRVMVDIEPCEPQDRRKFVLHVARLLGFPKVWSGLTESLVPVQAMYRPAIFEGESVPPVIASRTDGVPLTLMDIPQDIEEEVTRSYAYQGETGESDLSSLPIRGLKPEDIREPLFKIDPDLVHKDWCSVICGLLFQFREEDEAEEAFRIFDEWSAKGDKYRGEEKTYAKWASFKPEFGGRRPTTIKTLFLHAVNAGWKPAKIVTRFKANFAEWLEECDDPDTLLTEGSNRIADTPFKNGVVEEAMARMLKNRIKATHGGDVSVATILNSVRKVRTSVKREQESKDDNKPAWLRPWCYVRTLHKWYNTISGCHLVPEAFNASYGKELMSSNPEEEAGSAGRPLVEPVHYALNLKNAPQVDRIAYDPRKGSVSEPFFELAGQTFVNEYRWSTVPSLDLKNADKAYKYIKQHLRELFPDDLRAQRILLDWMAFIVQRPGVKIRWAPVIQGAQGCGKTFLSRIIAAAIGEPNVKHANPSTIKQQWNDWAISCQLAVIEEIWVAGKGRTELMNSLKDIMTNDVIVVNQRNKDSYSVQHVTQYIAFTNHLDALPLEESDRRWLALKCHQQTKADVRVLKDKIVSGMKYFQRLGLLLSKFPGAVRAAFLAHEISADFDPDGEAPETEFRDQMVESAKNRLQTKIEDLIDGGGTGLIRDDLIFYPALEQAVAVEARNNHEASHYLMKMGFMPYNGGQRFPINGSKGAVWTHGDRWDEGFGSPFEELQQRYEEISDESI